MDAEPAVKYTRPPIESLSRTQKYLNKLVQTHNLHREAVMGMTWPVLKTLFEPASQDTVSVEAIRQDNDQFPRAGIGRGAGLAMLLSHAIAKGKIKDRQVQLKDGRTAPIIEQDILMKDLDLCVSQSGWDSMRAQVDTDIESRVAYDDTTDEPSTHGMQSTNFQTIVLIGRGGVQVEAMHDYSTSDDMDNRHVYTIDEKSQLVSIKYSPDLKRVGELELKVLSPEDIAQSYEDQLAWLQANAPEQKTKIEKAERRAILARWLAENGYGSSEFSNEARHIEVQAIEPKADINKLPLAV